MDGAVHDLSTLGPRLHTAGPPLRLAEAVEGGCQPVLALSKPYRNLIETLSKPYRNLIETLSKPYRNLIETL